MTTIDSPTRTLTSSPPAYELTPAQEVTFTQLLGIGGGDRPFASPGLADDLEAIIADGIAGAVSRWTGGRLWISKSGLFSVLRCESAFVAEREQGAPTTLHPATAVGIVSHRAIQIAHTHPSLAPFEAVEAALEGAMTEPAFERFWTGASIGQQSDLLMQMTSRVTLFLDSWPRLSPLWVPRFEESIQARVGGVVLAAKPDIVLGRPRADMRQTMFLCDLKTGALQDQHYAEAQFYALVSTLRFRVAPYRSVVYSLASGTYTEPDVTEASLRAVAAQVVEGINATVDVMTERREARAMPGAQCRWCPLRDTCPSAEAGMAQTR